MSLPDEISDIIGRAVLQDPNSDSSIVRLLGDEAQKALLAAGYVIVPSTNSLLKKGEGVKIHE